MSTFNPDLINIQPTTEQTTTKTLKEIDLSPQQQAAIDKAIQWFNGLEAKGTTLTKTDLVFVISGYAGTGKTTAVRELISQLELSDVEYATYTGKAALVLRKYNDVPARTIHSLIYKFVPPDKKLCSELFGKIKASTDVKEQKELQKKLDEAQAPQFVLNENSDLQKAELLVLDECSMVNDEMLNDLISFQTPIIALGDPGQLPPIEGTGALFNVRSQPDALLTEIHRQAAGNPIIEVATRVRNKIPLPPGKLGEQYTNTPRTMVRNLNELLLKADQVLCGKNRTRQRLNVQMRYALQLANDQSDPYPVAGDKLICLKNDTTLLLLNGMFGEVVERKDLGDATIKLSILMEDAKEPREFNVLRAYFDSYFDPNALKNVKWWERKKGEVAEFDFGYAITVHKSQGSQWEHVLLYDDKFLVWDRKQRAQWLYTAVTRAANELTVIS